MRRRDALLSGLYAILGLLAVAFLVYVPVLVAWSSRYGSAESLIAPGSTADPTMLRVPADGAIAAVPGLYHPLLDWHASLDGYARIMVVKSYEGGTIVIFRKRDDR